MYPKQPTTLSAKDAAIRLLSRRDHGVYELQQKLTYKGYELVDVEQAINFCIEHSYLDDLRYARSQVRQHVYKGHGERRIRQELSQKRVDESLVDEAIIEEDIDWYELAKATAHKQFKGKRAKDNKEYAKQVRFMQYRGYTFDQISYAIESFG